MDYFNKLFLFHTGFTVMAYVNYIRIKRAAQLLRMSDDSVLDIALSVGYDSHEGFIKAFKKIYETTPTDYRKKHREKAVCWGDLTDVSCIHRFLQENPDFVLLDADEVIDHLLEKNPHKYGYLCTLVKPMGLWLTAPAGSFENGFLTVCDDRCGGMWVEAVTDDMALLAAWLQRFNTLKTFYTDTAPETVAWALKENGLDITLESRPQMIYLGEKLQKALPEDITVRQLTAGDKDSILQWANGKMDGYIRHLLTQAHYADPGVLEYGVFRGGKMIAAVGCGIETCKGFAVNNCAKIRFAEGQEDKTLYQPIFEFVVNDILDRGVLPFDDVQHGAYAQSHGDFTAEELGFLHTCWQYNVV